MCFNLIENWQIDFGIIDFLPSLHRIKRTVDFIVMKKTDIN